MQRPLARMFATANGGIFGRQAESVPAVRMQNAIPIHHPVTGHRIADCIVTEVPHVDIAGRISEHHQQVKFLSRIIGRGKEMSLFPLTAPFFFYVIKVVNGFFDLVFFRHFLPPIRDIILLSVLETESLPGYGEYHTSR